jgi:hypothetical protein
MCGIVHQSILTNTHTSFAPRNTLHVRYIIREAMRRAGCTLVVFSSYSCRRLRVYSDHCWQYPNYFLPFGNDRAVRWCIMYASPYVQDSLK